MHVYYLEDNRGDIIGWDRETGKPGFYRYNAITARFVLKKEAHDFIDMLRTIYSDIPDIEIVRL